MRLRPVQKSTPAINRQPIRAASALINPPARQRPVTPQELAGETSPPHRDRARGPDGYEVGYGKPPVHTRFKKGQSGNPKGAPKKEVRFNTMVRKRMLSMVNVRTNTGVRRMTRIETVFEKTLETAMKGNQRAIEQVLKLYAAAEPKIPEASSISANNLTETDEAILAQFKAELRRQDGGSA